MGRVDRKRKRAGAANLRQGIESHEANMRFWFMIVAIVLGTIIIGSMIGCATNFPMPVSTDEQYIVGGLTGEKQEKPLWCAAAASRMLMSQYGKTPAQCEIAGMYHGENCCKSSSVKCSKEVDVTSILREYGFDAREAQPSFDTAWNLVKGGRAVAIYHYFMQGTPSASGHTVIAYWAYVSGGKKYLIVYDPYIGDKRIWDDSYVVGNLAWYKLVWVE